MTARSHSRSWADARRRATRAKFARIRKTYRREKRAGKQQPDTADR